MDCSDVNPGLGDENLSYRTAFGDATHSKLKM
jgi:hypothetical protein